MGPLVLGGLSACPPPEPGARCPEPPKPLSPPAILVEASGEPGESKAIQIARREDVPLKGVRVDANPGDWMLTGPAGTVVVNNEGRIVDFGPTGGRDEMAALIPTVSLGIGPAGMEFKSLTPSPNGKVLFLRRAVAGRPLEALSAIYLSKEPSEPGVLTAQPGAGATTPAAETPILRVDTVVHNTSDETALAVTLGEQVGWGNVVTWLEGKGPMLEAHKGIGDFVARDGQGVSYALCSTNGPLYTRFDDQEYSGFFEPAQTGESVVLVPAHGTAPMRSIQVSYSARSMGSAIEALPCTKARGTKRVVVSKVPIPRARLEVVHCAVEPAAPGPGAEKAAEKPGKPYATYREVARTEGETDGETPGLNILGSGSASRSSAPNPVSIALPPGCFQARLTAPGHVNGPWADIARFSGAIPKDMLPVAGKWQFEVIEVAPSALPPPPPSPKSDLSTKPKPKPGARRAPPAPPPPPAPIAPIAGDPVAARIVVRGIAPTPDPDWGEDAEGTGQVANVISTDTGKGEAWLPPGKYRVLVNRGFEYTAHEEEITIDVRTPAKTRAAIARVTDTKGWIASDLHLHAAPSPDAPSLLTDRVKSLVAAGIEVAVATDHNAVTDYGPAIRALGAERRIARIIGDEITTRDLSFGHFNAFPLAADFPPIAYRKTLPARIFDDVRAARPYGKDTILQVNHPRMGSIGYFDLLRFDQENVAAWLARAPLARLDFDTIEIFNGDHYTRISKVEECLKDWYALLNAGYKPTATGNSDSHRVGFHEPGAPRTLVAMADDSPEKFDERAFITALRKGQVTVSSGPFVLLFANGQGIGAEVPSGETEIKVTVDAPPWVDVDKVELIVKGETIHTFRASDGTGDHPRVFTTKKTLEPGSWIIAIARGSKPMSFLFRSGATPFGFTNPIWVKGLTP